jgi:hypothetical protein
VSLFDINTETKTKKLHKIISFNQAASVVDQSEIYNPIVLQMTIANMQQ